MPVAIVIPARLESTRLPLKLLLSETGRPLLSHTVERAVQVRDQSNGLVTRVVVAIDDERLQDAASQDGADVIMTRSDHVSGSDRIAEAAAGITEDIVVNIQADEPQLAVEDALLACRLLAGDDETAPMGTLVTPLLSGRDDAKLSNPAVVKCIMDGNGYALYFSRECLPHVRDPGGTAPQPRAYHHLGVYAYRRAFLLGYAALPPSPLEQAEKLEQLRALSAGHRIKVAVVERAEPGIDTRADYERFKQSVMAGKSGT